MLVSAAYSQNLTLAQKNSIRFNQITVNTKTESESEEQFLLKSIESGNRDAFWQLWILYQDYLYQRCLMWMRGNYIDAEEALSRAKLKAWEKLPKYASRITNPKAWLTRITHNLCVDIHRERQKGAKSTQSIEIMTAQEDQTLTSSLDSPESALLRDELMRYICAAIDNLPPKLQAPFILHYCQQKSYKNIAQKLALSQDNVYKRIQQARERLRRQLKKYFSGVDISSKKEIQKSFVAKEIQVEKAKLSELSVSVVTTSKINPINYQVTASCLEILSLSWFQ